MDPKDVIDSKVDLRKKAFAARDVAWRADPDAGAALARQIAGAIEVPEGAVVSGYWPLEGEIDVRPALAMFHEAGHPVGLPVVVGRAEPLLFRRWQPGCRMIQGSFRVMTPPGDAALVLPRFLLVPLLAFDGEGYRLGYGGGFYDRTLAALRPNGGAVAIGVAYAAQEVAIVPRGPFDQPLDYIVTERGVLRFGQKKAT